MVHESIVHECSVCGHKTKQKNPVKNHSDYKPEENREIFLHRVWDPGGLTLRVLHLQPCHSPPDDLSPDSSLPHALPVSQFAPGTWPDNELWRNTRTSLGHLLRFSDIYFMECDIAYVYPIFSDLHIFQRGAFSDQKLY